MDRMKFGHDERRRGNHEQKQAAEEGHPIISVIEGASGGDTQANDGGEQQRDSKPDQG